MSRSRRFALFRIFFDSTRRSHLDPLLPLFPGRGPLDAQDERVVAVPVELVDGALRVVLVDEVDKGEPAALARFPVERDVDARDRPEGSEQLLQILLARVLGEVGDAHAVLLPSPVHGVAHGRTRARARAHGGRHVPSLARRAGVVVAGGLFRSQPERVHRRQVLVRALRRPVVALLAADAAHQQRGVSRAGHRRERVARLLGLALGRGARAFEENLFDGNRRHGLVAGFVSLRVPELGPLLTR
mmetsp:Transcript_7815/g.33211  ORF Transcript_7815/g.33211 Transcript_7815/m.33211 type:complete len:244 (-) Transcript_7815:286-1017(-)